MNILSETDTGRCTRSEPSAAATRVTTGAGTADIGVGGRLIGRLFITAIFLIGLGFAATPVTVQANPDPIFDIKEPAYLPAGVSFLYATYQATPAPAVTLFFKIIHPEYGDKGRFFQIAQAPLPENSHSALNCGEPARPECELLDLQGVPVLYQKQASGPESLDWSVGGLAFSLFRMAGEPGRVYKDELVKVAESLK